MTQEAQGIDEELRLAPGWILFGTYAGVLLLLTGLIALIALAVVLVVRAASRPKRR